MLRRPALFLAAILIVSGAALAQTGGQLWVRAYEDRNQNGVRDAGEPLLTRGISVNLLDDEGVIIASALLDNSPNAAQGLVGFQLLPSGSYSVQITSAEYAPTGADMMTATVSDSGVPPVLEYGAVRAEFAVEGAESTVTEREAQTEQTTQLVLAAAGSVAVMCVMAALGVIIYFFTLRSRLLAARAADRRTTTGSMRPVQFDTGEYRRTGTGEIKRVTGTGEMRRPDPGTGEFRRPPETGERDQP